MSDTSEPAEVPFEDVVAAILRVDPQGITGKRTKKDEDHDCEPSDND